MFSLLVAFFRWVEEVQRMAIDVVRNSAGADRRKKVRQDFRAFQRLPLARSYR